MRTALAAGLLVLLAAATAQAQDEKPVEKTIPKDRLTLTASGTARVPADQVEIEVVVEASGEDAAGAEKKHRSKLKRVQESLAALKKEIEESKAEEDDPPSFTIELREGRSSIGVGKANAGDGSAPEDAVTVATAVLLRMKGIADVSRPKLRKRLAKIIDTAIDAGADSGVGGVGSRPALRFRAKDNEELRAAAQKDALEKARGRAKRLAELAGRGLGALASIAETGWMLRAGSSDQVGFDSVVGKIGNNKLNNYEMTTSSSEIELECEITVEFEMK